MTTNLPVLVLGVAIIYGAGIATGWHWARRATSYMLGDSNGRRA
jgi:hypothetical protein